MRRNLFELEMTIRGTKERMKNLQLSETIKMIICVHFTWQLCKLMSSFTILFVFAFALCAVGYAVAVSLVVGAFSFALLRLMCGSEDCTLNKYSIGVQINVERERMRNNEKGDSDKKISGIIAEGSRRFKWIYSLCVRGLHFFRWAPSLCH